MIIKFLLEICWIKRDKSDSEAVLIDMCEARVTEAKTDIVG